MLDYLQLYPETLALIKRYPKEQRYDLIEAQMEYACKDKEPDWPEDDTKWLIWEALKLQVDRTVKKVEQNKANGKRNKANASETKRTVANRSEPERSEANASEIEPTSANRITKNYELRTMKDIDDDATAHARESTFGTVDADPVILAVQSELTGLTVSHYDDLAAFRKDLPDDLVIEAINEAVAHGARTWAYVRSILQGYIKDGIKTVGQARQRSEKRKREGPPGKRVSAQAYTQREYSDEQINAFAKDLIQEARGT